MIYNVSGVSGVSSRETSESASCKAVLWVILGCETLAFIFSIFELRDREVRSVVVKPILSEVHSSLTRVCSREHRIQVHLLESFL